MNWTSQSPFDLKLGLMTRDNMIAYMEDALKSKVAKFEDQEKHPKLFAMCSIVKEQSRDNLRWNLAKCRQECTLPRFYPTVAGRPRVGFVLTLLFQLFNKGFIGFPLESGSYKSSVEVLQEGGDLGKDLDPIQQLK
ncbi:hypothetical protein M9H77_18882 [Catharanthus roseus]|uniref:Uncharacterized protein n=1 Tax=Catharanthus roseus TaxID=4058 RepID=A0ACC0B8T2_CATRO|nr:hypothetical protein M9H77_18882 [Catharanthus roseus]